MILIVANGYPPTAYGGVEVYAADVGQALATTDQEVAVLCREHRHDLPDGSLTEDLVSGVPVYRLVNDFKQITSFKDTYLNSVVEDRFLEVVQRISPDLIHFNHLIALSGRLPLLAANAGIPSIYTLHDFWLLCPRVNLSDWRGTRCAGPLQGGECRKCITHGTPIQRMRTHVITSLRTAIPYRVRVFLRGVMAHDGMTLPVLSPSPQDLIERYQLLRSAVLSADRILVPSQFVKDTYAENGYPAERIEVLPLGLGSAQKSGRTVRSQHLRIGYVGPILSLKGVDVLIRAFRRVRSPGAQLKLFGRLDIAPSYTRRVRLLAALDRRIHFMGGFQPEERDRIYSEVDLLVLPSLAQETFSLVAREALLRGIPVVASRVGALKELIHAGINGWLVEPGSVKDLTRVLRSIVDGPVAMLSVEDHLRRLGAIYDELQTTQPAVKQP
jgi:glycosyltransferase involved in cell wall biosynthesis